MKILFVSLFLPQEKAYHAGGRYVFEIIRTLSQRHEIDLVTRIEQDEVGELEGLRPFCKSVYPYIYRTKAKRGAGDVLKLIVGYLGFSRFAGRVAWRGAYDIVQVEWTEAAVMMKKMKGVGMILDAHDVITKPSERIKEKSVGAARLLPLMRYLIVKSLERRIVRKFDLVFTRSGFDRDYLLGLEPGLKVSVVAHPAGLDITEKEFRKERNAILFLASYKYRRINVDAAFFFYRFIFPLIRKEVADAKFIAAGYGPPEELTNLQEKDSGVVVPGFVEDIDRCYKEAAVFVAPILVGGGIIVKILDAMAAGIPVVTTDYGNEGIDAVPGRDLLVANEPEDFAASVVKLLKDPEFAGEMGKNGRAFVKENYSLEAVVGKIEGAYEEISKSHSAQGQMLGEC